MLQATANRWPAGSAGGWRSKPVRKVRDVRAGQANVVKFTVRHPEETSPGLSLQAPLHDQLCGAFRKADKDVNCSGAFGDGTVLMHDCHCLELLLDRPSGRFSHLVCPGVVTLPLQGQIQYLHTRLAEFARCARVWRQAPFSMQPASKDDYGRHSGVARFPRSPNPSHPARTALFLPAVRSGCPSPIRGSRRERDSGASRFL